MSEIQLPEAFLKLGEVLEQGQFELLFTEEKLRLVYLMNDAVESFLVFENARMTGQYREDYEGELEAELSVTEEPEESYVLVVHQGETVVTIFFEDLSEEVHLYDYGEIGPILLLCVLGIITPFVFVFFVGRKLFHNFWFERSIFIFGWITGVVAIGVTLLRIVDPEGKSGTFF